MPPCTPSSGPLTTPRKLKSEKRLKPRMWPREAAEIAVENAEGADEEDNVEDGAE